MPLLTQTPSPEEEAAQWWMQYRQGLLDDPTSHAAIAFKEWIALPANAGAWHGILRTAQALDDLPAGDLVRLRPATIDPVPANTSSSRRRGLIYALGIGAVFVTGVMTWRHYYPPSLQPLYAQEWTSRRGQVMEIGLPDGSRVNLDTQSKVQVMLYKNRREIQLQQGQAVFQVAADKTRPFVVAAGKTRITAVGTRFQVRLHGSGVSVAVEEGTVKVDTPEHPEREINLVDAGQSLTAEPEGRVIAKGIAPPVGAWRTGRVTFENSSLQDALAEFERYGDTGASIQDARVAALKITGSFNVTKADEFIHTLPLALPVRLKTQSGRTEIVLK